MDDKDLDKLLKGLNEDYNRLPEFTDEQKIISQLPEEEKRRKRSKALSYVAVAAGVFLFIILALPIINDYEQEHAEIPREELLDYYTVRKEAYRQAFGLASVDDFYETMMAREVIKIYPEVINGKQFEQAKSEIDRLLTTPNQIIHEMNEGNKDLSEESLTHLFEALRALSSSFDNYYSNLKINHALDFAQQEILYEKQYDYQGPVEFVEFLNLIHEQGFRVVKSNYDHQLPFQIRPDYHSFVEKMNDWKEFEEVAEFLTFMNEKFDVNYPGIYNMHDIPWYEFDDVLLEWQAFYHSYPEHRELIFEKTYAKMAAQYYLINYLTAGTDWDESFEVTNKDKLQIELQAFLASNPDSVFYPIISSVYETFEQNDWKVARELITEEVYSMFAELDQKPLPDPDEIYSLGMWPIFEYTENYYEQYQETKNLSVIANVSPFEFLSFYLYVFVNDEMVYQQMSEETEGDDIDWIAVYHKGSLVFEERVNEKTIQYIFNDRYDNPLAFVQLTAGEEGWKVTQQELLQ